jgi:endoglucanase
VTCVRKLECILLLLGLVGLLGSRCSKSDRHQSEANRGELALKACPQGALDDAEDNDNQIIKQAGRDGYWFTYADKSGTTVQPAGDFKMSRGGPPGSNFAAHMHGRVAAQKSGKAQYAGLGFSLTNPRSAFDLSHAKGISFWAKGPGRVRVKLPDVNTAPEGGHCSECYNDFGKDLEVTARWERYGLLFREVRQEPNWGDRVQELSTNAIFAVEWQCSTPDSEVDIWVDNVELVGCE